MDRLRTFEKHWRRFVIHKLVQRHWYELGQILKSIKQAKLEAENARVRVPIPVPVVTVITATDIVVGTTRWVIWAIDKVFWLMARLFARIQTS